MIIPFTIEARLKRKARDLNPHPASGNRLSRAARPTISAYLPRSVDSPGIEPAVFPINTGQTASLMSSLWTMSPFLFSGPPGSRTPISWLQARCRPVGPAAHIDLLKRSVRESNPAFLRTEEVCRRKHLQTIQQVIPDGVEPSLSWVSSRRLSRWTTGSRYQ